MDDALILALKIIRKECEKHEFCEECPLAIIPGSPYKQCLVEEYPENWNNLLEMYGGGQA